MDTSFFHSPYFTYLVLPLLIFLARIGDVTIGTIRIIMVSKGKKVIAPILGFFEVGIWILAISRIMQNLDNWVCYIAYAGGFAAGNYIGMIVEEKLAVGTLIVRIITQMDAGNLISNLREAGYGVTSIEAMGNNQKVHVIFSVVKRAEIGHVVERINHFNPKAFYTIEDLRYVSQEIYPLRDEMKTVRIPGLLRWRKGK